MKYLNALLATLQSIPKKMMHFPPRLPPPSSASDDIPSGDEEGDDIRDVNVLASNVFGLLVDDSSDEDNDGGSEEDEGKHSDDPLLKQSRVTSRRSTQSRYLIITVLCSIVEVIRFDAIEAGHLREYELCATRWEEAVQYLNIALVNTDYWQALYLNHTLIDNHNYDQLTNLFNSLYLLRDHTEMKRMDALNRLQVRLAQLDRILNPQWEDRDKIRAVMGNKRWKENPAPKRVYAEKRAADEEERRRVLKAIQSIERLVIPLSPSDI